MVPIGNGSIFVSCCLTFWILHAWRRSHVAQQLQSRKWFWFAILFQNIFAYIVSLSVYQIGTFVLGGAFTVGTAVGIAAAAVLLILLFRPDPYKNRKEYSKRSVQTA